MSIVASEGVDFSLAIADKHSARHTNRLHRSSEAKRQAFGHQVVLAFRTAEIGIPTRSAFRLTIAK
jgi:hypothetical protein